MYKIVCEILINKPSKWLKTFTLICCKNCIGCLKIPKINEKEGGVGPLLLKNKINNLTIWSHCFSFTKGYVKTLMKIFGNN